MCIVYCTLYIYVCSACIEVCFCNEAIHNDFIHVHLYTKRYFVLLGVDAGKKESRSKCKNKERYNMHVHVHTCTYLYIFTSVDVCTCM